METTSAINCLHPSVILNPNLKRLLRSGYHFGGFDNFPTLQTLKVNVYFPRLLSDFQDYMVNNETAQKRIEYILLNCFRYVVTNGKSTYPVFYMAKCNHCVNCLESKKNDLVQRVMVEAQQYEYPPLFVTLTYDDEHTDGLLHRKDFIDFMKRLRINAQRFVAKHPLEYDFCDATITPYRYFACGEYGGKTQRPHFHLELNNYVVPSIHSHVPHRIHPDTALQSAIRVTKALILKSWKNGDQGSHSVRPNGKKGKDLDIQIARNCGSYIAKYMSKDISQKTKAHIAKLCNDDPDLMKDHLPFIKYSQGLGKHYFDRFIRSSITPYSTKFYIKNRLSTSQKDRVLEIPLVGYWRNRCFPCLSSVYKKKHPFRDLLRVYCLARDIYNRYYKFVDNIRYSGYIHKLFQLYDPQVELFRDYFSFVDDSFSFSPQKLLCNHQEDIKAQLDYLKHLVDYFICRFCMDEELDEILNRNLLRCEKIVATRELHLTNLLSQPREILTPIQRYTNILNKAKAQTNKEIIQLR